MNVLIIGANERTGRQVTQYLRKTKNQSVAMIRDSAQRVVFDDMGVPTVSHHRSH